MAPIRERWRSLAKNDAFRTFPGIRRVRGLPSLTSVNKMKIVGNQPLTAINANKSDRT
jgi:hypothetical protein